tara:strand:+ start:2084 stop:2881 length:798 start_codon:yes stop_codon:yes gene_type:complete
MLLLRPRTRYDSSRTSSLDYLLEASEMLVIRRQISKRDPWSGQLAYPGGHREEGESDEATAIREVREEVGIDASGPGFQVLGKVNDRNMSRLIYCALVVVYVGNEADKDLKLTLQEEEIADAKWLDLSSLFYAGEDGRFDVRYYTYSVRRFIPKPLRWLGWLSGTDTVIAPAVYVSLGDERLPFFGITMAALADLFAACNVPAPFLEDKSRSIRYRARIGCCCVNSRSRRQQLARMLYGTDDEFWVNPYARKRRRSSLKVAPAPS